MVNTRDQALIKTTACMQLVLMLGCVEVVAVASEV